jgi:zinc D-Ala-D-Ala carboxypeptidase
MMMASPHFSMDELTFSETAERFGIDNNPKSSESHLKNLQLLANGLEQVRATLDNNPIIISSGYRCLELNRLLRSKDTSKHTLGLAADFTCRKYGSIKEAMEAIVNSSIEFDQLILEFNRWIHISFAAVDDTARRQALVIDRNGAKSYS